MRLDFNVLWVEDQPSEVEAQAKSIAKQMAAEGFHFNPVHCQSIDDVKKLIAEDNFTDEIDLILVDWDLGAGTHGEDAIAEIRAEERFRYKDIVFYSALKPAAELSTLAAKNRLEGIFCAAKREDLVDEVIGLFESLIKKVLDISHARGIVMGATSDIDYLVRQCLETMHGKLDGAGQGKMLEDILGRISERIDGFTKKAGKLQAALTLDGALSASATEIFTSNDRLRILRSMLVYERFKEHGDARPAILTYLQEVVPHRTELAHVVLVPDGKPQAVMDTAGKLVTIEEMREKRQHILGLRDDFRELLAALKGMQ